MNCLTIRNKKFTGVFFLVVLAMTVTSGCMSFTQKDYDLQEKAYQKERQQKDAGQKDAIGWRW